MGSYRLGIDIGGTFTDFVLLDGESGEISVEKCLTTGARPEAGVFDGVDRLAERHPGYLARANDVNHATTLVTNVILERKGARTGLVTTRGFRDILEMGREVKYTVFRFDIRFPPPLVPRELRLGVTERVLADGTVRVPLDEAEVRSAAAFFRDAGVEAIAVCFLHAYRNPSHELRAAEILADALPGVHLSCSHEVHPEPKEYERTSTTVVDAYIKSVASGYLDHFAEGLGERGFRGRPYIMLSNGGTATLQTAKQFPVRIVESGPAAGVEAAMFYGGLLELDPLLAFDMGGTTAKLCIVEHGRAVRTRSFEIDRADRFKAGSGIPVAVPVYDLLEIGAGGGSIARVNNLGLLQVGPQSAGSTPGPACYGRGGTEPTVTDADLVLGYLNADYFLGGEMPLDTDAARRVLAERIARPADLSLTETAAGIHELVNETMGAAARVYVSEKAQAPSDLVLIASGGAGPVHATGLARKLRCPTVVVPPYSGVMSAIGLLSAPIAFERSRAVRRLLCDCDPAELEALFVDLENETRGLLPADGAARNRRVIDLRYSGQDYALETDIGDSCTETGAAARWQRDFEAAYERLYGRIDDDNPVEVANLRVHASLASEPPRIPKPTAGAHALPKAQRGIYVFDTGGFELAPVYERSALRAGQEIEGPAVVEERESTLVLGPGDRLEVDSVGCLRIAVALPDLGRAAQARTP